MPRFDLGESNIESSEPSATPPVRRLVINWTKDGQSKSMILIAQATVDAGRQSTRDLCLRVEPDTEQVNYEKSMKISSHHFSLRYVGTGVQFLDMGSTNGSTLDSKKAEPNSPILIDRKSKVSLSDVLDLELEPVSRSDDLALGPELQEAATANAADPAWLQRELIGTEKPGKFGFLRISRTNNLSDTQYVLLYHSGKIGSGDDCLLRVSLSSTTPRRRRAFDVVDSAIFDCPARLFVRERGIWLERTGAEQVIVAGDSLEVGECRALASGEMTVAETTFSLLEG